MEYHLQTSYKPLSTWDMGEWVTPAEPAEATSGLKGSKSRSNRVSSFFTSGTSFCSNKTKHAQLDSDKTSSYNPHNPLLLVNIPGAAYRLGWLIHLLPESLAKCDERGNKQLWPSKTWDAQNMAQVSVAVLCQLQVQPTKRMSERCILLPQRPKESSFLLVPTSQVKNYRWSDG